MTRIAEVRTRRRARRAKHRQSVPLYLGVDKAFSLAARLAELRNTTPTCKSIPHDAADRPSRRMVYQFDEGGPATRTARIRGGKGASLATLSALEMPVPPGFTITISGAQALARARKVPKSFVQEFDQNLRLLEKKSGAQFGCSLKFGCNKKPLLVSVRSGAAVSMPGMMDTILNVGISKPCIPALAKRIGERAAWHCYLRFLAMFGATVMGAEKSKFEQALETARDRAGVKTDSQLPLDTVQALCDQFQQLIAADCGETVPEDPLRQLSMAVFAVISSWDSERATAYRQQQQITDEKMPEGTAVNVQAMVFGNAGDNSLTGVVFSRNPATGKRELYGEYLPEAQGEDLVAGVRTPLPISRLGRKQPGIYKELAEMVARLETHYLDMMDVEFTVEAGKLYMLQCRPAQRTVRSAAVFAVHQVHDRMWTKAKAMAVVSSAEVKQLQRPRFQPNARSSAGKRVLFTGLAASPGSAVGEAIFTSREAIARSRKGGKVVLVRPDTSPDDLPGMIAAQAIVTKVGGSTSHAAVVARGLGKPAVVGCGFNLVDDRLTSTKTRKTLLKKGAVISVDGDTGTVIRGALPRVQPRLNRELRIFLSWLAEKFKPSVNFTTTRKRVSVNTVLNDFYLSQALATAAEQTPLMVAAANLHDRITIKTAELFSCYLLYAVATEIATLSWEELTPPNRRTHAQLTKLFGSQGKADSVFSRLKKMDSQMLVKYLRLTAKVFRDDNWMGGFGGEPWARIAETARDFLRGKLAHPVFIDHVFDLRHNGGTLFDKHTMVQKNTDEYLLQGQLDSKKRAKKPRSLFEDLSSLHSKFDPELKKLFLLGKSRKVW
jgi:phosphoenolpyruvate synthase/pyruvate phosphate dikinase